MIYGSMTRLPIARGTVLTVVMGVVLLVTMNVSSSIARAQATNNKTTSSVMTAVSPPKITAYCKIQIYVSNHPTVSGVYRVDTAGNITLPLDTGEDMTISVCDLTAREAALVIDKFVRVKLKNPYVTVSLIETRDQASFYVLGAVAHPGKYKFDKSLHLSDVLKLAGGLRPTAKSARGSFSRNQTLYQLTPSLLQIANPGKGIDVNPQIEPDDRIYIRDTSLSGTGH